MPTSDEISRTEAPVTDFEVRLFVGGKRDMIDSALLATGLPWAPTVETRLTADVDSDSTSIPVDDTSFFSAGAILIQPYGDREAYEFISYTGKTQKLFTGLTRLYSDPGDTDILWGKHESQAPVSELFEVTEITTRLEVSWDEQEGAATWKVKLDGRNYDSFLLDNDNVVVAHLRQRPYNGDITQWSPWGLWWLGYIKKCDIKDDAGRSREWDAEIEGVSQYVSAKEILPRHYGKSDLAADKSVTVSSTLEDPYQEWGTGEFEGFPSLDESNINDGDMDTLWISDGEPARVPEELVDWAFAINEVYLRPPEGYNTVDNQWIELFFRRGDEGKEHLGWYSLCSKNTTFKRIKWYPIIPYDNEPDYDWDDPPRVDEAEIYWVPETNYVDLSGGPLDTADGEFVILTFNRAKFLERYPNASGKTIIDIRPLIKPEDTGVFELDLQGDLLLLRNAGIRTVSNVYWSDHTDADWDARALHDYDIDHDEDYPHWEGDLITVPPRAHSFRRYPTGWGPDLLIAKDGLAYWKEDERHPTPGHYTDGDAEWLSVDLGEMGITLEVELAAAETNEIRLSKNPLGLRTSGMVRINQEIISYASMDSTENTLLDLERGVDGTTPSVHPADSIVKAQDALDVDPSTNHLISAIQWRRREVLMVDTGKPIVPTEFDVYISEFVNPVMPDDDDWDEELGKGGWEDYWDKVHTVDTGWDKINWIGPVDQKRCRHVLMIIKEMTNGGRVKINQFYVWAGQVDMIEVPPDADEELRELADAANSGAVIFDMLHRDIDLDPSLFTLLDEGRNFVDLHTATSSVLQIIKDIGRRTGTTTVFNLDETVIHHYHPLYPLAGLEDIKIEWDRDNARSTSLSRPFRHNIKQVVVQGRESENDENFEGKYPYHPLGFGSVVEMDDWILADPNDATLMAQYIFRQKNAPLSAIIVPVGPAEWVQPGQRHTIHWDMDAQGEYLNHRNFVVLGIKWRLNFGGGNPGAKDWRTTIRLKELIF